MELLQFTLPTGAKLTAWLHSKEAGLINEQCYNRPAIVVCPGGISSVPEFADVSRAMPK